jgi:formate dehydrogenase iron-sulfur subunit
MSDSISRRSFLKAGLITAGVGAASGSGLASLVRAAAGGPLCTLLDLSLCIGCEECVYACREVNGHKFPELKGSMPEMVPRDKVRIADWSDPKKRAVTDRLTPYNWLYIQQAHGVYNGRPFELNIPRRCMHCNNPPCSKLCPFGAAYQQYNGIVVIHPEICMGGAKCKTVCPWDIPERQSGVGLHLNLMPQYAGNGVMYKCDRCFDRVARGELPACIEVCPERVQQIGPRSQIIAKAKHLAEETKGFIYGMDENAGTNTIYVSPIPFELLHRAVEKGPGRPHLQPVADAMSAPNRMFAALALAPVAGIVGALARFRLLAGNRDQEKEREA